jgi:hypothetical protein
MNFISILIYSDPYLGYDRYKFTYPPNSNYKCPNNGSGLCNQLFRFINAISYLDPKNNQIYFDFFSKDYLSGELCSLSEIIDLKKMNETLDFKLYDVSEFKIDDFINNNYQIHNDHFAFRTYNHKFDTFISSCKSIIWKDKYLNVSNKIIDLNALKRVNLVHLRIDQDFKKHIVGNRSTESQDTEEYWQNRNEAYDELVKSYEKTIYENCDSDIPLVILMEETSHQLVKKLENDFEVIFFDKELIKSIEPSIDGREFFALIDLLIGLNLNIETYIGLENKNPLRDGNKHISSFSILLKYLANYKKCIMV